MRSYCSCAGQVRYLGQQWRSSRFHIYINYSQLSNGVPPPTLIATRSFDKGSILGSVSGCLFYNEWSATNSHHSGKHSHFGIYSVTSTVYKKRRVEVIRPPTSVTESTIDHHVSHVFLVPSEFSPLSLVTLTTSDDYSAVFRVRASKNISISSLTSYSFVQVVATSIINGGTIIRVRSEPEFVQ